MLEAAALAAEHAESLVLSAARDIHGSVAGRVHRVVDRVAGGPTVSHRAHDGIAGLVYASRLRSVSTNIDGGTLVLYSVAAAVIGGTSMFGGRGRARNAVLGGVVIAAIYNGMDLQGYSTAARLTVTAVVLVVAVAIDSLTRRGRTVR